MSRKNASEPCAPKQIRCAIYTRKSTEEGLEQDFNSLDAQRASGEAFIVHSDLRSLGGTLRQGTTHGHDSGRG